MKIHLIWTTLFLASTSHALEGVSTLEQMLKEKNQGLLALQLEMSAKERLATSAYSVYYPSLEAVGGWGDNRMADPSDREKGYFGYLDGRINLFRGFKDDSIVKQRNIAWQIAKLEYDKKWRELRQQLTEATSEMIYLHKLQDILTTEENITKQHKQMAAKKVASGLTSSVDNLEFDLREEELRIQKRQIDQRHEEAHQKLMQLLGEDIADSALTQLNYSPFEAASSAPAYSPEKNLELQRAQLNFELREQEKKEARSEFLPSVDFTYSFGRVTPSENSPIEFNESLYAVKLSIPLFSGFDSWNKIKASRLNVDAQKSQSQQTRNDEKSRYDGLTAKMAELSDLYKINERKLVTSKKYFDMTVAEYKRGIKNSPDLVGATERWFSSQKTKYELLKELEITKSKLENLN